MIIIMRICMFSSLIHNNQMKKYLTVYKLLLLKLRKITSLIANSPEAKLQNPIILALATRFYRFLKGLYLLAKEGNIDSLITLERAMLEVLVQCRWCIKDLDNGLEYLIWKYGVELNRLSKYFYG